MVLLLMRLRGGVRERRSGCAAQHAALVENGERLARQGHEVFGARLHARGGMNQSAASRPISVHVAPISLPVRTKGEREKPQGEHGLAVAEPLVGNEGPFLPLRPLWVGTGFPPQSL
jgi:hypothetical protein